MLVAQGWRVLRRFGQNCKHFQAALLNDLAFSRREPVEQLRLTSKLWMRWIMFDASSEEMDSFEEGFRLVLRIYCQQFQPLEGVNMLLP